MLQDSELIEIVHHRTLEHQLAIAMRRRVSAAVSDALVEEGSPDVIKTLLENPNAAISLWEKMAKVGGGGPPQFLSTHPSPENRQQRLAELAPKNWTARRAAPTGWAPSI